jgi:hypothetical protein
VQKTETTSASPASGDTTATQSGDSLNFLTSATQGLAAAQATTASIAHRLPPLDYRQVSPPAGLEDFFKWSETRRAEALNRISKRGHLTEAERDFFRASLLNPQCDRLERHLMAEALHKLDVKIANLNETFVASIDNPKEEKGWRLYAVQHLARTITYTDAPEAVTGKLTELVSGTDGEMASQAALMLDTLQGQGQIQDAKIEPYLARTADNPDAPNPERITALSLLGRRQAKEHVGVVRKWAAEPSGVQRSALAALGELGDASDAATLEKASQTGGILERSAAQTALKRLKERQK